MPEMTRNIRLHTYERVCVSAHVTNGSVCLGKLFFQRCHWYVCNVFSMHGNSHPRANETHILCTKDVCNLLEYACMISLASLFINKMCNKQGREFGRNRKSPLRSFVLGVILAKSSHMRELHFRCCPTDPFAVLELYDPSIDVF